MTCPDCGRDVSDLAPACPGCGRPIAPTTIEATGKSHKAAQAIGAIVLFLGVIGLIGWGCQPVPVALAFIGAILYLAGRIGGWWHHG